MADLNIREQEGVALNPGLGEHALAATVAVLASMAIHGLLVFAASKVDLRFLGGPQRTTPEREFLPIQLGAVTVDPDVQVQVLRTLRELGASSPADLQAAADELHVAPETGLTDPPPNAPDALNPEPLEAPSVEMADPGDAFWTPRQEILAVESLAVGDVLPGLERRRIPAIERIPAAPDVVPSVASSQIGETPSSPQSPPSAVTAGGALPGTPVPDTMLERQALPPAPDTGGERFVETPDEITDVEPLERMLTARLETYGDRRDKHHAYFRLVVERAGEQILPVRPKDVLLVQDASASMAEQRLYFCREAMRRALARIGPADRFNVAVFSERTVFCFPEWKMKTPETIEKAESFINAMTIGGNTDLFASMRGLLSLERQPGRPVIALVMTDGLVNAGITDSTAIIGAFTRENQDAISVFTMGVSGQANRYLLDILSFCNGGEAALVDSGRWDIPAVAEGMMDAVRRPVLSEVSLRFGAESDLEVYPRQIGNLYLDRPMVLYGRYRRDAPRLVFQALGQAGQTPADMIFDLPLPDPPDDRTGGDRAIRETWGRRKLYHLIGVYARERDSSVLRELRRTAREFGLTIPYREAIGL